MGQHMRGTSRMYTDLCIQSMDVFIRTCQSLRFSYTQSMDVDEVSDQN